MIEMAKVLLTMNLLAYLMASIYVIDRQLTAGLMQGFIPFVDHDVSKSSARSSPPPNISTYYIRLHAAVVARYKQSIQFHDRLALSHNANIPPNHLSSSYSNITNHQTSTSNLEIFDHNSRPQRKRLQDVYITAQA
jgi:hypothetical protein